MNGFYRFILRGFSIFYPYKVYNRDNVPKGAAVFICNHFRAIDCAFVADVYCRDIFYLAKEEVFKNKLLAKIIKSLGGIPINRDNPSISSILKATKALKDGHKLAIFPEGTRNKSGTDQLQEIKSGSGVFAVKAKVPILPIMLSGKARMFRRTKIYIGKPFELSEYYDKKLTPEVISEIDGVIREKMLETQIELKSVCNKKKKKCKS